MFSTYPEVGRFSLSLIISLNYLSNYRKAAIASCHKGRRTLTVALKVRQIQRLLLDKTSCHEAVARLHLTVLCRQHMIETVAEIFKAEQTVGRPSYLYLLTLLKVAAHELTGIKERRIIVRALLQPKQKRGIVLMSYVCRQRVEGQHTWLMAVADVAVQSLQRRRRHEYLMSEAQYHRELLKVGGRGKVLAVMLLNKAFQLFYFRCVHSLFI